jgi:hypothetical protein
MIQTRIRNQSNNPLSSSRSASVILFPNKQDYIGTMYDNNQHQVHAQHQESCVHSTCKTPTAQTRESAVFQHMHNESPCGGLGEHGNR